jgi:uncharacterized membrane protein YdjX (TVP38/TMEM64 family)
MRRYWTFVVTIFVSFLVLWLFADALGVTRLTNPTSMERGGLPSALLSVGLLTADSILPIPSVLIMVANGALFGFAVGTALSLAGKLGCAVTGFLLGRSGRGLVHRLIGEAERQRGERFLARWGLLAILVSRPLPLLAETVVLLAGTSGLRLTPVILISPVGSIPEAAAYGLAGATAASFGNQVVIWLALLALAALLWLVLRRIDARVTHDDPPR